MAKNFRNVRQLGSLLEHSAGERMPEKVSGDMFRTFNPGTQQTTPHNMADARRSGERHAWGIRAQEHSWR
jgi:hypothetical protein